MRTDAKYLKELLYYLERIMKKSSIELAKLPEGHLLATKRADKTNYFIVKESDAAYKKKGISRNHKLI